MSSNVKTNHKFFLKRQSTPPTYSKLEKKICMHKGENNAEKLIRIMTLKMIEKENDFF